MRAGSKKRYNFSKSSATISNTTYLKVTIAEDKISIVPVPEL
jgi:hypothetical protein